jgi:hypothetical protein
MLHELKPEATKYITRTLTSIVRACALAGCFPQLTAAVVSTGLLGALVTEGIQSVHKGYTDHIAANFVSIVGLFSVWDTQSFISFMAQMGAAQNPQQETLLGDYLDIYNRVRSVFSTASDVLSTYFLHMTAL